MSYVPWSGRDFGRECIATWHTRATTWLVRLTPFTENTSPRNPPFIIIFAYDVPFSSKTDETQEMPGGCVARVLREDRRAVGRAGLALPVAASRGYAARAAPVSAASMPAGRAGRRRGREALSPSRSRAGRSVRG